MIEAKAPGKLFIAGEYAVTEPGNTAILVAIDRFITVFLEESAEKGSISIYNDEPISWMRKNEKLNLERHDARLAYILAAINIVEKYAKELGKSLSYYHIRVKSDLEAQDGIKYGLGSSAAVTVATINALCKYYHIEITEDRLFKLSALANLSVNSSSSCGDIAACAYGGWIAYKAFHRNWVLDKQNSTTVSELLSLDWPALSIESLIPPKNLNLVIGWTGVPSSTTSLVDIVNNKRVENSSIYNRFLSYSNKCVKQMIDAFKDNNTDEIQRQIKENRKLLVKMSNELGVEIETPKLTQLCDIALKHNGSAKSSGAGGGDCGIAVFKGSNDLHQLIEEWKKSGITYLPLKVFDRKGEHIDK